MVHSKNGMEYLINMLKKQQKKCQNMKKSRGIIVKIEIQERKSYLDETYIQSRKSI